MYRLLISYKLSLRSLLNHRRRLQKQILQKVMSEAQKLAWQRSKEQKRVVTPEHLPWSEIKQVAEGREDAAALLDTLDRLGPMITTLNYVIRWIQEGGMPAPVREVNRRSKEQREKMWLCADVAVIKKAIWRQQQSHVSEEERELLADLLTLLSPVERDAFVMVRGHGLTYEETAEHLGLSRGNISTLLKRAEEKFSKIRVNWSQNEQFVGQLPPNVEGEIFLQRSLFE